MGSAEVEAFLSQLTNGSCVSQFTQRSALNALVFLYNKTWWSELVGTTTPAYAANQPKALYFGLQKTSTLI